MSKLEEQIEKELKSCGAYWKITEQDVGRELFIVPMGEEAFKIKARYIASRIGLDEDVPENGDVIVKYTITDFIKLFTPFSAGCHFKAIIEGNHDFKFKLGCWGVMFKIAHGLELDLSYLFELTDNSIHSLEEVSHSQIRKIAFDFTIPELIKAIKKIPPCPKCGGTIYKKMNECHICKYPKNKEGSPLCSYPHPPQGSK